MALTRATNFTITVATHDPDVASCEIDAIGPVDGVSTSVFARCRTTSDFTVLATVPGGLADERYEYVVCPSCLPYAVRALETEHGDER